MILLVRSGQFTSCCEVLGDTVQIWSHIRVKFPSKQENCTLSLQICARSLRSPLAVLYLTFPTGKVEGFELMEHGRIFRLGQLIPVES